MTIFLSLSGVGLYIMIKSCELKSFIILTFMDSKPILHQRMDKHTFDLIVSFEIQTPCREIKNRRENAPEKTWRWNGNGDDSIDNDSTINCVYSEYRAISCNLTSEMKHVIKIYYSNNHEHRLICEKDNDTS